MEKWIVFFQVNNIVKKFNEEAIVVWNNVQEY